MSVRPTFMGFYTARSGIVASQANQDITGQNLTNILTPGYTRQRADLYSVGDSGYKSRFADRNGLHIGQGVNVGGTSQLRDAGYDVRYRLGNTKYGYHETQLSGLEDINRILDEFKLSDGIFGKLGELYSTFQDALNNSQDDSSKLIIRNQFEILNRVINQGSQALQSVKEQQEGDFQITVDKINMTMQKIAHLNQQIKEDALFGNPAHELKDDRNLLLDELSGYLNISYKYDPNKLDELSVDFVMADGSKMPLIQGEKFVTMDLHFNSDVENGNTVAPPHIVVKYPTATDKSYMKDAKGNPISGNKTFSAADCDTGAVGSYFDILGGDGDFGIDTDNRGVPYYQKMLDTMAATFAQTMNDINRGKVNVDAEGKISPELTIDQIKGLVDTAGRPIEWQFDKNVKSLDDLTEDNIKEFLVANRGTLNKGAYVFGNEKNLITTKKDVNVSFNIGANGVEFTNVYTIGNVPLTLEEMQRLTDKGGTPLVFGDANGNPIKAADLTAKHLEDGLLNIPATVNWLKQNGAYLDGKLITFPTTTEGGNEVIDMKSGYSFANSDQVLTLDQIKNLTDVNGNGIQWVKDDGTGKLVPMTNEELANMGKPDDPNAPAGTPKNITLEDFLKANAAQLKGGAYLPQEINAGNIAVSDQWMADPQVLTNTFGTKTAQPDGNNYDNEVFRRFIENLNNDITFTGSNGKTVFVGSFQDCISNMEVIAGKDQNVEKSLASNAAVSVGNLDDNRMAISGVDENEETANMMMFQKAFAASSRMMTTMDEMLDVLINKTGVVGR